MSLRLMILGLDGATFDVINRLKDAHLPNLKKVIETGVYGDLESTFPPVTGPSWFSCATGKNPGKTGIFQFFNRTTTDSFEINTFSSSKFRQIVSFWDYLDQAGIKVGIWNYPKLYPPYKIKGFMTSGFPAAPQGEFTYPKALKNELLTICPNYRIHVPITKPRYSNNPALLADDILELLDQNEKTLTYLLEKDVEVLMGVISASDFAQHAMWKYLDPEHPLYDEKEASVGYPLFIRIWQRIDKIVGLVLSRVEREGADLIIVSDHGFGTHTQSFYTNLWLESEGYLKWRTKGRQGLRLLAARSMVKLSKSSKFIFKLIHKKGGIKDRPFLERVDMRATKAFAGYHSTNSGNIYINNSSESPLKNHQEYESTRNEIIEKLKHYFGTIGLPVVVHLPGDIYSGPFTDLAPDIMFAINDFECSAHPGFGPAVYQDKPHKPNHNGSHRMHGIIIVAGPNIKKAKRIESARIYDVAPTILHMVGLPVPKDMDGVVLQEIFNEDSRYANREVTYLDSYKKVVQSRVRKTKQKRRL